MQEQRLFHRYPTGLKVGFRTGKKSYRGRLANVSAGGGYIVTDARPRMGSRVQMAARRNDQERSIWLDLRVARTVDSSEEGGLEPGFGGFWLHASSRHSEERLRGFLDEVLGITRAIIRPMTSPSGAKTVYVYKFPDVYAQGVFEELPWLEDGNAGAMDYRSRRKNPSSDKAPGIRHEMDADPVVVKSPPVTDSSAVVEVVTQPVLSAPGSSQGALAPASDSDVADARDVSRRGRWDFLVKKLAGIRRRQDEASHVDVAGVVCQYRIGSHAFDATIKKCGTDWIVFEPSDRIPEVWARIVLTLRYSGEQAGVASEVHATVTRLKEMPDSQLVHCKINQVEELRNPGSYKSFVQNFNR